jgi:hypothetical protein
MWSHQMLSVNYKDRRYINIKAPIDLRKCNWTIRHPDPMSWRLFPNRTYHLVLAAMSLKSYLFAVYEKSLSPFSYTYITRIKLCFCLNGFWEADGNPSLMAVTCLFDDYIETTRFSHVIPPRFPTVTSPFSSCHFSYFFLEWCTYRVTTHK